MALSNKENLSKLDYRVKLLAGNNVVLVEANNYESEIFLPQIVNGRITFQNIIQNRRCCGGLPAAKRIMQNGETPQTLMAQNQEANNGDRSKVFTLSPGQERAMPKPLANSTPASIKGRSNGAKQRPRSCGSLISNDFIGESLTNIRGNNSSLPTPEPMRRAVPASQQVIDNTLMKIPRGIKIMPLYHNSMEGTPKHLGRLVATSSNASQNLANLSRLNGSFRVPSTPILNSCRRTNASFTSPLNRILSSNAADGSVTKWRKVITPIRTYTRRCAQPLIVNRPTLVSSTKKSYKTNKVIPTYLINPTLAPKVTHKVEIKKRKMIIDGKVRISPRTFKKQQLAPLSPAPALPHRKSLAQKTNLQPSASYSSSLPKSRHQLESLRKSAFDLLTNSNRHRCMNDKLNKQFRNGCLNKASSTCSKYKQLLASIPPLQQDEQILELSRISLQNNTNGEEHHQNHQIVSINSCSNRISLPLSNNNKRASSIDARTNPDTKNQPTIIPFRIFP